jgi:hypothetical protein
VSIALTDIDQIPPHPENPKGHDLATLTASIRRFGFAEPVVVDQRTGLNVSGHGRVEALQQMRDTGLPLCDACASRKRKPKGCSHPPEGITVEEGVWLVPVFTGWRSASDDDVRAALVALNRTTEIGGWNNEPLLALLDQLGNLDGGLAGVGFDDEDIATVRRQIDATLANPLDPYGEWEGAGMPDYEQDDIQSAFRVTVHFPTDEDADAFFALLERPKKRTLWWPKSDGHVGSDQRSEWVADEGDASEVA